MKKALCRMLAAILFLTCLLPVDTASAESLTDDGSELLKTVDAQLRAFAKSLDQKDADDEAAWALARHGVSGRGKTLKVGQSHPLTATLLNSEMGLSTLIRGCYRGIRTLEQMGLDEIYDDAGAQWLTSSTIWVNSLSSDPDTVSGHRLYFTGFTDFTGKPNAYDTSLVWMAGSTEVHTHIRRLHATADAVTYQITTVFEDRFDFNTGAGSVPRELASLLGSFLFKEFNWTATVEYTLTVPNTCCHGFDAYHWRYDAETESLVSQAEAGFGINPAVPGSSAPYGQESRYFELARPVLLRHNVPWELEYTVRDPGSFALSPTQTASSLYPYLLHQQRTHLFFQTRYSVTGRYLYTCHGYTLADLFDFNPEHSFTVHLENVIREDGSNMVYVSVYNNDLQKTVLEPAPMDDRYLLKNGVLHPEDTQSQELCGRDLRISYIGNALYGFHFGEFDLKIWENGRNGGKSSGLTTETAAPTCTSPGYTTQVCSLCHMEEIRQLPVLDHTPGPEATCTESQRCLVCGTELHPPIGHRETSIPGTAAACETAGSTEGKKCALCEEILQSPEEIPALGHQYQKLQCVRCGMANPDYLPGDANGDGVADYADALRILRASIGLETFSEEIAAVCDVNRSGKTDYADALLILRASIGL